MQNGTISELYADDKKSKYSCNIMIFLSWLKAFIINLYTKEINVQNCHCCTF